jgi:D-alanyl-D-alanine carboxypeptidase
MVAFFRPLPQRGTPRRTLRARTILAALALASLLPAAARAQIGSYRYSSIIVDDSTGRVTEAVNADASRYPASLTKLMTLYVVFEALRDHRITLDQLIPISEHTASMEPTKLGLVPGSRITVEEAILAAVTRSANDAACALGELVGGSEDRFAQMMTLRARALGMTHSTFRNASGLPDPEQVTTARDLALLAHHLIQDFPDQYHYFSVPSFTFHGHLIPNHDRMLEDYDGADGLKTGYTVASGHNLVTSAKRGNVRLIGVVLGASSNTERDIHMASLLDTGFENLGVPIEPRTHHFRLPSLIASAEAAPLHARNASLRLRGHNHLFHGNVHHDVAATAPHPARATAHGRQVAATTKPHTHHHPRTYASRDTRGT